MQAVLEMSKRDKGGRGQWDYNEGSSSVAAGPSSSYAKPAEPAHATQAPYGHYVGGYVPARTPSPKVQTPVTAAPARPQTAGPGNVNTSNAQMYQSTSHGGRSSRSSLSLAMVSRVKALYPFTAKEQGELSFERGDIIKVVDQMYADWWRGQLKGRTGIFPTNYVV